MQFRPFIQPNGVGTLGLGRNLYPLQLCGSRKKMCIWLSINWICRIFFSFHVYFPVLVPHFCDHFVFVATALVWLPTSLKVMYSKFVKQWPVIILHFIFHLNHYILVWVITVIFWCSINICNLSKRASHHFQGKTFLHRKL